MQKATSAHPVRGIRSPAFISAVGLFFATAMGLWAHLVVYWIVFSGRFWPRTFRTQIVVSLGAIGLAASLLLVAGLSRLLRKAFPGFRLTLPDRLGRKDRAEAMDFLLAAPEPPARTVP